MSTVTLDFETRSELDIKKVGAWRYAEHPSTDVLCLCYSWCVDGEEVRLGEWRSGEPAPADLLHAVEQGCTIDAHNAQFELAIWTWICRARWGWPPLRVKQLDDTMAACAYRAVPLKLDRAGKALGLATQKDAEGGKILNRFGVSKPRKPSKHDDRRWLDWEDFGDQLVEYCTRDVCAERALRRRVGELPPGERKVWLLDQRINARGVEIDADLCEAALEVAGQVEERLDGELAELTGGAATKASQRDRLLSWVRERGVSVEGLAKDNLDEVLARDDLPEDARRALQIRQVLAKSSWTKYRTALDCVCDDGRARGLLQYHAAQTGRWGGRLIQPQNMRRPVLGHEVADLVDAVKTRDAEWLGMCFGDPMEVLADAVRGMFVASESREFVAGDYSGVEARILYALAGQRDARDLMARGEDVYAEMATRVFGHTVDKETYPVERDIGKRSVLGLGYGMGAQKFKDDLKSKANLDRSLEFCQEVVDVYRGDFAPRVPEFWRGIEDACFRCVVDGEPRAYGPARFERVDRWLTMRLPSGRRIRYYDPHVRERPVPWDEDETRPQVFCWSEDLLGRWAPTALYGGALTGHCVQATARDLLVHAMFRAERAGLPVVLTVHDELVAEPEAGRFTADDLGAIMAELPSWAEGWPIVAECWTGGRYKK